MRFLAVLSLVMLFIVIPATILIIDNSGSAPDHGTATQTQAGGSHGIQPSSSGSGAAPDGNQGNANAQGSQPHDTSWVNTSTARSGVTYFEIVRNELMLIALIVIAIALDRWFFRTGRRRFRRR